MATFRGREEAERLSYWREILIGALFVTQAREQQDEKAH